MLLLVGAVARANQRTGEDRAEAERLALLAVPAELIGVHPPVDLRVLRTRLQILSDLDHVDAMLEQVAQHKHPRARPSACDEVLSPTDRDGFEARVGAECPQKVADVVPHGLDAHVQFTRDLLGRAAVL